MQNRIDDQLWNLRLSVDKNKVNEPYSDWVLFAISRYIKSGKASRIFEKAFVEYDADRFVDLIHKCLKGDKSDEGIICTCKRVFNCQ